jgi:hypothetical protein
MRRDNPDLDPDFFRTYWQERRRAALRVFNDPEEVEKIVEMLESVGGGK